MRIGDSELEYFVDYLNKRIHILDLDHSGMRTLTNAIDPTFQRKFVEQEHLLSDVLDFQWLCYATDGIIAEYRNYNFKFVPRDERNLHQPYVKKMEERKNKYK